MLRLTLALLLAGSLPCAAQDRPGRNADRDVYLDGQGVVRWRDDRSEVTLFGANYVIHTASDYRAAGYVGGDRKAMIDEDMAQFARMGWDGIRLTFWGDWESADTLGNLIENDHLDLLDYLIARARERGIYMLFSPIQLYSANWPDALADTTDPGFGRRYNRGEMGTNPKAIAAQVNYLRQILNHVNPYTGVALKDEPAIAFIELVNEPVHHSDDIAGSIRYIDTLTDAVRSTGCRKLIFYNVSQDFAIGEAVRRSKAQGVTFGWYPTGLNSGHELEGNYLRTVDVFPDMLRPELMKLPRIVYEFDSPDLRTGTMYPAMARTMRSVGTQFAAMFSYDMLRTASRNLGWQTHYLNLVYTPRKAMSAIIASEAMRRLPRMKGWGAYPSNTRFGDFRVDPATNLGELAARDAFMYTGTTTTSPPDIASLRRIAGHGSSPIVSYEGVGIYFLDRVREGVWRLEVYPDAVAVADPFVAPTPEKIVTRAIARAWPMRVSLPDLGEAFTVKRVTAGSGGQVVLGAADPQAPGASTLAAAGVKNARGGTFTVTPGVWLLSANGNVDVASLPARVGAIGFAEYHPPPPDTLPMRVASLNAAQQVAGTDARLRFRIVDIASPDSATLWLRAAGTGFFRPFPLARESAYMYAATIAAAALRPGLYDYVVTATRAGRTTTFPSGSAGRPTDWDFQPGAAWSLTAVDATTPLRLFDPSDDFERLAFSRIGDGGRRGLFRLVSSAATGEPAFHLELPVNVGGISPEDYTASLVVEDRIGARGASIDGATAVRLRVRGIGARQLLHVSLMERDGTTWTAPVVVNDAWSEQTIPLDALKAGRGVLLPQGFPGQWSYWVGPAEGRGGPGDRLRMRDVERLQLSLRREEGVTVAAGGYGVEVEWVTLGFGGEK